MLSVLPDEASGNASSLFRQAAILELFFTHMATSSYFISVTVTMIDQ